MKRIAFATAILAAIVGLPIANTAFAANPGPMPVPKSVASNEFQVKEFLSYPRLFVQDSGPSIFMFPSVRWTANNGENDLADDFIVPEGHTWRIKEVASPGFFLGGSSVSSYQVSIYADKAGSPGKRLLSRAVANSLGSDDPNADLILTSPFSLKSGHYWLSIQANIISEYTYWLRPTLGGEIFNSPAQWRFFNYPVTVYDWSPTQNYFSPMKELIFYLAGFDTVTS